MLHLVTVFTAEELPEYDPDQVTPGVIGFIAIAFVAVAAIFLLLDMNRRVRRIQYREQIREELSQELADREAGVFGDPEGGDPADSTASDAAAEDAADEAAAEGAPPAAPNTHSSDNSGR